MVSDQKSVESFGKPSRVLGPHPPPEAALSMVGPVRSDGRPSVVALWVSFWGS